MSSSPSSIASNVGAPAASRSASFSRAGIAEEEESGGPTAASAPPIVCFCHLGWDWVWQRPQQFLSRLSRQHRVLFVETYCSDVASTSVQLRQPDGYPNVTVLAMHLPSARWSEGNFIDAERRRVLRKLLAGELAARFARPILWFYDPMAVVAFAGQLGEQAIVYDCMDELSQFKGAPPALIERERLLLQQADVVFCGGRKMRDKRRPLNRNCHFYGTGVDCAHFGQANSPALKTAPEIAALRGPVLGYFGVIDERIDYELLAKLADANPHWHLAMVGPTTKVDPATFPQRANLHWLGAKPYAQLPALTKGFSVCLMPFALNASTEFINPTKALEYMAAGRPVVSTALDEVRTNFRSVPRIGRTHDEFIELCRREAAAPSHARIRRGLRLAAENTWDAIAAKMEAHVAEAVSARATASAKSSQAQPVLSTGLAYV